MVWLPVLQIFPCLKAARMSGWWFLALFIPVLNLVASIMWCVKIAQARGKSVLVGILLLLPVLNIFAFLYLAFSSDEKTEAPKQEADEVETLVQTLMESAYRLDPPLKVEVGAGRNWDEVK